MMLQFIPFPLLFSLILLTGCVIMLYYRKRSIPYLFFFALFGSYLISLVGLTLFPIPLRAAPDARSRAQSAAFILSRVNLIPLDYSQFNGLDPTTIVMREVVDNILLTMPFGFLVNFISRSRVRKIPALALAVGTGIELAQLVMCLIVGMKYRGVDINDAIMNALGVMCGYGCFCLFSRLFLRVTARLQPEPNGMIGFIKRMV